MTERALDLIESQRTLEPILNHLDTAISVAVQERSLSTIPPDIMGGNLLISRCDASKHWTQTTSHDSQWGNFLELAASYGILPFVKAKLSREPALIDTRATYLAVETIIHDPRARFGTMWGSRRNFLYPWQHGDSNTARAISLITFLMENAPTFECRDKIARFIYTGMEPARPKSVMPEKY